MGFTSESFSMTAHELFGVCLLIMCPRCRCYHIVHCNKCCSLVEFSVVVVHNIPFISPDCNCTGLLWPLNFRICFLELACLD